MSYSLLTNIAKIEFICNSISCQCTIHNTKCTSFCEHTNLIKYFFKISSSSISL